jgi:hypothetical protein
MPAPKIARLEMSKVFDDIFYKDGSKNNVAIPNVKLTSVLINGEIFEDKTAKIEKVYSPIRRAGKPDGEDLIEIGSIAMCSEETALKAAQAAQKAYGSTNRIVENCESNICCFGFDRIRQRTVEYCQCTCETCSREEVCR